MDKIFASAIIRKKFLFTIAVLICLLLLIRYCILPIDLISVKSNDNIGSFIDKFVASVFTAVVVGYFLFWMQSEEKKKELEFTESGYEIEKYLSKTRITTGNWLFNGGLGRYTKFATIPILSAQALKDRRTIAIKIIVINPFNIELLQKYIDFRVSVEKNKKKKKWTQSEVQSEILATIITAFHYKKVNQFLDISVNVKDFFTLSRMDISDTVAIITREDPAIPSIIVNKNSHMYMHYSEEFQQVLRQSKNVDYTFSSIEIPSKDEIRTCITALYPEQIFSEELLKKVYNKFKEPKSPF